MHFTPKDSSTAFLRRLLLATDVSQLNCGLSYGESFTEGIVHRVKGGLEAERAERVKCKQEDMERERRNFEAMQVSITALAHLAQSAAAAGTRPEHDLS